MKMAKIYSLYKPVFELYRFYWKLNGGFREFIRSPYLHAAALLSAVMFKYWTGGNEWTDDVISVIPSILGFSLGGYAIFLAFADSKFIDILVDKEVDESSYLVIHAHFIHFINVQAASIIFAIIGKAYLAFPIKGFISYAFSGVGFMLFIYALLSAVAIAFSLLRIGRLYNKFKGIMNDSIDQKED